MVEYYRAIKRDEGVSIHIHIERPPGCIIPDRRKRESVWQSVCSRMCGISLEASMAGSALPLSNTPCGRVPSISTSSRCLQGEKPEVGRGDRKQRKACMGLEACIYRSYR